MFKQINWPKIFFIVAIFFFTAFFVRGASALFSTQTTNAANTFSTGFWVTPSESQPSPTNIISSPTPTSTPTLTPTTTLTPTLTPTPTPPQIVINELMWAGSSTSDDDEWIELKNIGNSQVDLNGWTIENAGNAGAIITIPSGKSIQAGGFFLISHFSSSNIKSILATEPDFLFANMSLSNTLLHVVLKDNNGLIIDTAWNGTAPSVGSNVVPKKSMERNATPGDGSLTTNWHTSTGSINLDPGTTERGTPKTENSP